MQPAISPAAYDAFMRDVVKAARARVDAKRLSTRKREFRGAMLAIRSDRRREIMLSGPAGTGKSLGILDYINDLCWTYPGARWLIVRKVRADLAFSALVTFEKQVLGDDNPICSGMRPENRRIYRYPNGSEIVIGGMDRTTSVMSQEYDGIYVQEAVELTEAEWESLSTRLRNGVMPWQQIIGDCNPDSPEHWIMKRAEASRLALYFTTHEDNPAYWDAEKGEWTPEGEAYVLGVLEQLTGVRFERLRKGRWVAAEGAVYEDYRLDIHVIDRFPIPVEWRRIRCIDFGYTNPFVCQWWAIDPDGRMYLYREIYMSERTVEEHADEIKRLTAGASKEAWAATAKDEAARRAQIAAGERIEATVADHDAEDRATLHRHGVQTVPAKKAITPGIETVRKRYRVQRDGKARIYYFRDALVERDDKLARKSFPINTAGETPGYAYPKGADGKPIKEIPIDLHNHGKDAERYGAVYLDGVPIKQSRNPFYGHG